MTEQPDFGLSWWSTDDDGLLHATLAQLAAAAPALFAGATPLRSRFTALPFLPTLELLELRFRRGGGPFRAYVLSGDDRSWWLDGSSAPMHAANERHALALTDATLLDYVRYFLRFLRADRGAFVPLESAEDVGQGEAPAGDVARIRALARPLASTGRHDDGRWRVEGVVAYDGDVYRAVFAVSADGQIEMVDDEPLVPLAGAVIPPVPELSLAALPAGEAPDEVDADAPEPVAAGAAADAPAGATPREAAPDVVITRFLERQGLAAGDDHEDDGPRDRAVTEAVVAVLLEEAIRERDSHMLLQHFNALTEADRPLDRLARLLRETAPIVLIESDIPFVEEFVAGLLDDPPHSVWGGRVRRASPVHGDDGRCWVELGDDAPRCHLLSFHAYRALWDAERTAHELALRDVGVLVGCERLADVPEPLRRVSDLELSFPRIDRRVFARIFERVFGARPVAGWEGAGADWTRYLLPADFHVPKRLGLAADQALAQLRARVAARLRVVSADTGPGLADLHGLGEARQVCEDLMADIQAAQEGLMPWSAVDRGLLLVGPPGTGKTTLARAIAKECGIKFISASAASWQSAGSLDLHLRAIRADFSEARRYAPAIMFIDEIDGIGNRELLSGHGMQYQTEVINAVLEQVQGFDSGAPVIVLAATNHVEKVDPALRRAGRLDQVVHIPLPSMPSLAEIFRYHLSPHRAAGHVGEDVDERQLSELAFGLTGADVEFFVRGAVRRARKAQRPMAQADLVAEVTRRPRRADGALRLSPEEVRRVAVHEAGHALARLLSSSRGADVTFVTIIPRTDGSLGFVATVPLEGEVLTRRSMLERLETILAGRAAEEVVYGAQEVGLGAGGPSRRSDLAVATATASLLVCKSGLGEDGALHWTEIPTPAQEAQIEALLRHAYVAIVAKLTAERALLDRITERLMQTQELHGEQLRALAGPRAP